MKSCMGPVAREVLPQVQEIITARSHRSRFPETAAHKKFKESYAAKTRVLMNKYPFLDMESEMAYFEDRQ